MVAAQQSSDSVSDQHHLEQVVITAQYTPTDARQTVNSVKILTRENIEQKSIVNLYELLQTEASIRVSQDPILGSVISVNALKGENLKILIDGIPIVGRLNGSIDAGQVPLNSIQKVEIIEGAQSLLYGSDASGGVINIITKKSQLKKIESEVVGQYENNGFKQITTDLGYSNEKWIFQMNGNLQNFLPAQDTSMGRDQLWNPKKQKSARGLVRFRPDDRTDLRLNTSVLTEVVDNLGDIKRPQYRPYAFDDYYMTDRFDIGFHGERWTKNKNLLQMTAGWNTFQRIKNSYRYDFESGINETLEGLQDTSSTKGVLARFTFASDKASNKLGYIIGFENYYEVATGTRLSDTTLDATGRAYANDFGLFVSGKYKVLHNLTIQSGVRWTANSRYGSAFTPSTWLHWQPKKDLNFRTSWAYGFRSPAIKELFFSFIDVNHYVIGNPQLNPEKSLNLRSELSWKFFKRPNASIIGTVTGFYNNVKDRIILTALGPVHYEYSNVDEFKTMGGSIRFAYKSKNIQLSTELITTGFNNTNEDVEVPKGTLLWSPDWINQLTFSFLNERISWDIWHKRTGRTPYFYNQDGVNHQGFTDSWNMLNSGFSTHFFDKKIRLNFGVKNIFNITQLQVNNINGIHIEASNQQSLHWGRTFYATLRLKI